MNKPDLIRLITNVLKMEQISKDEAQGLEKAKEILQVDQRDLSGLDKLDSVQARAIAKFAVDFNSMTHKGEFFSSLGELIKKRNNHGK